MGFDPDLARKSREEAQRRLYERVTELEKLVAALTTRVKELEAAQQTAKEQK